MIVNRATLDGIFTNFSALFNQSLASATTYWQQLAMLSPSTGDFNDYKWISQFPMLKEWIGSKQVRQLSAARYIIYNKDWEATIEVDRNDIERDQLGIYNAQARETGLTAAEHPDVLLASLLNNAFAADCYDSQYFIDTDHSIDGSSVSNFVNYALSSASRSLAGLSIGAAITAIQNFGTDEGRKLNLVVNKQNAVLVTGPTLQATANILANSDKLDDLSNNPYQNMFTPIMFPGITDTTAWFLCIVNRPMRPFVFQRVKSPVFVSQTDMNADDVFNRKKYKYGVECADNAGYGLWQLCVGGKP